MTARHIRLSHVSGLVLGLGLLITVPTIGSERQTPASSQVAGRGAPASQTPAPGAAKAAVPAQAAQPNSRPSPLWEWEWWKDPDVQKELGLTDAKVKNISRIFQVRVKSSLTLAERFDKDREELNRLTEEQKVSVEEYAIKWTQVEALRSELAKGRAIMNYRIYRELTPEQNQKFREIRERRMNAMRNGRGRGTGLHH